MKTTTTRPQGLQSNQLRHGLTPGNTATIAATASTALYNPWIDRPPLAHGFAKPRRKALLPAGVGYGTAAASLRRERTFSHPDFDAPVSVESAHRFPAAKRPPRAHVLMMKLRQKLKRKRADKLRRRKLTTLARRIRLAVLKAI